MMSATSPPVESYPKHCNPIDNLLSPDIAWTDFGNVENYSRDYTAWLDKGMNFSKFASVIILASCLLCQINMINWHNLCKLSLLKVLTKKTNVFPFWAVLFLILSQFGSAYAQTSLNILISPPRGGYGDTAANLLMIERLVDHYSKGKAQIYVVYQKESVEQIHALWPDFNPNLESQYVRGILFTSLEKAQLADIALTFSSSESRIKNLGRKSITYLEYDEVKQGRGGLLAQVRDYNENSPIISIYSDGSGALINTGFGNGLYVKQGFRNDDFNKKSTFSLLRTFAPKLSFSDNARLAYAYNSSPPLTQQYINALSLLATKYNQEIVVVTNHLVTNKNALIKVINMKGASFDLNQKIIKSSDIPILVTGDGSLSLAVEGRKPFFYSLYAWKRFTPSSIRKSIEKVSPLLRRDRKSLDLIASLLRLDIAGNHSYEKEFLEVMENPDLLQELSRVYGIFVKTDSLVDFVVRDVEILSKIHTQKNSTIYANFVRYLWLSARKLKSLQRAIKKVENDFFNE
ncbi:MAG: hypothetical protein KDD45_16750, partial [Bdellovibrionales bacterium]|nr:hypothetical protein [Bdellovibrionales bacterium]